MTTLISDDCPRSIQRELARFGGENLYHRPLWRLVRAERRMMMCGGIFQEFEQFGDSINIDERSGKFFVAPNSPSRVEYDQRREIPMYPCDGWVLERWLPPHIWGTRGEWESTKAADGVTRLLGPYPSEGDYWMLGGPWEQIPDVAFIENEIAIYEYLQRNRSEHFEAECKRYTASKKAAMIARHEKLVKELAAFMRDEISPIFKSTSLEASRIRQRNAESMGDRSQAQLG